MLATFLGRKELVIGMAKKKNVKAKRLSSLNL